MGNSHVVPPAFAATFQIRPGRSGDERDETSSPARSLSAWRKVPDSNQEDHVVPSAFAALRGVVQGLGHGDERDENGLPITVSRVQFAVAAPCGAVFAFAFAVTCRNSFQSK